MRLNQTRSMRVMRSSAPAQHGPQAQFLGGGTVDTAKTALAGVGGLAALVVLVKYGI